MRWWSSSAWRCLSLFFRCGTALLLRPAQPDGRRGPCPKARANSTACTLYACSHVLNVPLGYNSGSEPLAQTAIDDATLDRARSAYAPFTMPGC